MPAPSLRLLSGGDVNALPHSIAAEEGGLAIQGGHKPMHLQAGAGPAYGRTTVPSATRSPGIFIHDDPMHVLVHQKPQRIRIRQDRSVQVLADMRVVGDSRLLSSGQLGAVRGGGPDRTGTLRDTCKETDSISASGDSDRSM